MGQTSISKGQAQPWGLGVCSLGLLRPHHWNQESLLSQLQSTGYLLDGQMMDFCLLNLVLSSFCCRVVKCLDLKGEISFCLTSSITYWKTLGTDFRTCVPWRQKPPVSSGSIFHCESYHVFICLISPSRKIQGDFKKFVQNGIRSHVSFSINNFWNIYIQRILKNSWRIHIMKTVCMDFKNSHQNKISWFHFPWTFWSIFVCVCLLWARHWLQSHVKKLIRSPASQILPWIKHV